MAVLIAFGFRSLRGLGRGYLRPQPRQVSSHFSSLSCVGSQVWERRLQFTKAKVGEPVLAKPGLSPCPELLPGKSAGFPPSLFQGKGAGRGEPC